MNHKWMLFGYDRTTERLTFERELPGMTVEAMRTLFRLPDDEPVIGGSVPVAREQVASLAKYAGELDADAFDYQIEAVAD